MHLQDADHWERKAAQARYTAAMMSGHDAKWSCWSLQSITKSSHARRA